MTKWSIVIEPATRKDLDRVGRTNSARVLRFLNDRVLHLENPRQLGKPLKGAHAGLWRYRVGDLRIVCEIRDSELIVLVVSIGHRREIYR